MGSVDEGVRRMRSLVTHKQLKDIALAQADEVRAWSDVCYYVFVLLYI
jgi:hypothetical protein